MTAAFAELVPPLGEDAAVAEADRCLECDGPWDRTGRTWARRSSARWRPARRPSWTCSPTVRSAGGTSRSTPSASWTRPWTPASGRSSRSSMAVTGSPTSQRGPSRSKSGYGRRSASRIWRAPRRAARGGDPGEDRRGVGGTAPALRARRWVVRAAARPRAPGHAPL